MIRRAIVVASFVVGGQLIGFGCMSALPPKTETYEEKLDRCKAEARADFYVGRKTPEESIYTFDLCMQGRPDAR